MPATITGTLVDAATNLITAGTFVRFLLKGTQGIQPIVTGVGALVVGSGTGQGYFVDFIPNASGVVSGSVYSTRDSTGLLAGEIKINGNGTACWWEVSIWRGNKKVSSVHTHAKTGTTLDIGNLTAISTTPVATAPSGDSTYARLDGSNQPFTGNVSLGPTNTLNVNNLKQQAGNGFNILDPNGVDHFFISSSAPYVNTFIAGNGSGSVFLGIAGKTNVADTTGNITSAGSLTLQTTSGTLPAIIANDTAGGILFTNNAGGSMQLGNGGTLFLNQPQGIRWTGATSGNTVVQAAAIAGSGTLTLPGGLTDQLVSRTSTDTLTNKIITQLGITGGATNANLRFNSSAQVVNGNTTDDGTNFTTGTLNVQVKRIKANQGTALVTGDVGSLVGWGTTATVSAVLGTDAAWQITIASSGTAQASGASFVLTFHDGTWTNSPICVVSRGDASAPNTGNPFATNGVTATSVTVYFHGTPIAGNSYVITGICIGR